MKEEKTFTSLYFGVLPEFGELMGCLIEEDEGQNIIQPLGCRELLFTDPRLLLSPCLECGHQAVIVFKRPVLKCSKLQTLMKKLKFKIVKEVHITKTLFEYCLGFTLTQKLAPLWNKVGEYLVQGRDFLENGNKLNAVAMDVSIREDKLCMGLKAFNIRLRQAQPNHFCTSSNVLQHFFAQKEATIEEYSTQDSICFVLPSLKKARVVSIHHQIPSDCPFASYEDLRKHWKLMLNAYFYLLDGITPDQGKCDFLYPSSCIRSALPQVSPRCNQQAIFHAFLQDIQARSPVICESPLKLTSSPFYCTNKLYSAANGSQSSLTRVQPDMKQCTPFVTAFNRQDKPSGANDVTPNIAITDENKTTSNPFCSSSTISTVSKPARAEGSRFIPSFTKSTPQVKKSQTSKSSQNNSTHKKNPRPGPPIRPVFGSKVIPKVNSNDSTSCVQLQNRTQRAGSVPSTIHRKLAPSAQNGSSVLPKVPTNNQDTPCVKKLPEVRPGLVLMRGENSVGNSPSTSLIRNSSSEVMNFGRHPTNIIDNTTHVLSAHSVTSSGANQTTASAPQASWMKSLSSKENASGLPVKRQNGSPESNPLHTVKKPRMKPKVQEDVDVKQFALANQLNKVNASTLIDWLKKRNVPVRLKDKKAELMEKVMKFIKDSNTPLYGTRACNPWTHP